MKYFLVGTLLELSFLLLSTAHAIPAAITAKAVLPAIDKRGPIFSSSVDQCLSQFQEPLTSAIISLQSPPKNLDFLSFCATFLRTTETEYLWTSTTTSSVYAVAFSTTFPVTTSTATTTGTTTVLCPIPSPSQVCGGNPTRVWGFTSYPNYDNLSPNACKQMCLANPACRSFISSLDYDEPVEGLPGKYATHDCGLSDITLQQAMDQGTLYIPYDPKWRPSPGDSQGFYDRGCPEFLPSACFSTRFNETENIDSPTLVTISPNTESKEVKLHMLSSANRDTKNEIRIRNNAAALYENFNDLTATVEFSFQLVLICRCEPVQPIPPATKTVTGVATHYLTTSTKTYVSTRTVLNVEYPAMTTVVRRV